MKFFLQQLIPALEHIYTENTFQADIWIRWYFNMAQATFFSEDMLDTLLATHFRPPYVKGKFMK